MASWAYWNRFVDPFNSSLVVDNYQARNDPGEASISANAAIWTPSTYDKKQLWSPGYQVTTADVNDTDDSDAFNFWVYKDPNANPNSRSCQSLDIWWVDGASRSASVPVKVYTNATYGNNQSVRCWPRCGWTSGPTGSAGTS